MAQRKRLFKARFYSGCVPAQDVNQWVDDLNTWVDGKFGTGLCAPGCEYLRLSRTKRMREDCPEGQVSIRLTIRGYCLCPD